MSDTTKQEARFPPRVFHSRPGGNDVFDFYDKPNYVADSNPRTTEYLSEQEHAAIVKELERKLDVAILALKKIGYTTDVSPSDPETSGPCRISVANSRNRRILEAQEALKEIGE